MRDEVRRRVDEYYSARLRAHGPTPRGVDWSCAATQWLRFRQLLRVCSGRRAFSLIDLGCGYGALADYLDEHHPDLQVDYTGLDVSPAMVRRARRRGRGKGRRRFLVGSALEEKADFTVASGILNIRLGFDRGAWEDHAASVLADMRRMSRSGFAVNFLSASPPSAPPELVYVCGAERWIEHCEKVLSCSAATLSDYGLREFTLLARIDEAWAWSVDRREGGGL